LVARKPSENPQKTRVKGQSIYRNSGARVRNPVNFWNKETEDIWIRQEDKMTLGVIDNDCAIGGSI